MDSRIIGLTGIPIDVTDRNQGRIVVEPGPPPPIGESSRYRYYNKLMGSGGAGVGTTNMNVDGSSTPQTFYIEADPDYDLLVMVAVFVVADTAVVHSSFGNVAALSNGVDVKITEDGVEENVIDAAKTGGQFIAQAGFSHPYGDGAQSFELINWTGTQDAQTIVIPFHHIVPGGVRIGRGTRDTICTVVNDDLTGLTEFTARIIGYKHYP